MWVLLSGVLFNIPVLSSTQKDAAPKKEQVLVTTADEPLEEAVVIADSIAPVEEEATILLDDAENAL